VSTHEIGDGPNGPEPLITVSKRTAALILIGAAGMIFALCTVVWVMWGFYRTAVHDRDAANAVTACARQINAESVSAMGFTLTALGDLNAQLGTTIKTLTSPDPQERVSAFNTEAGKLQPLSDALSNQSQVLKAQLDKLQQVNTICSDGKDNP